MVNCDVQGLIMTPLAPPDLHCSPTATALTASRWTCNPDA